jgi:hypothetical protein
MKLFTLICDTPGLPSYTGTLAHAEWRGAERLISRRTRGGAIAALKQTTAQGTSVPTVQMTNGVDFPYIPVRAGEQDLT